MASRRRAISISPTPYTLSAATQANGTSAAMARSIIVTARCGLVAKANVSGTCVAAQRRGSSVQAFGR